jgi:phosphopentomutase
VDGYAKGLENFDIRLGELMEKLGHFKDKESDDIIIITADHGCDPTFKGTDHTREYVPLLIYGKSIKPGVNLGTSPTFADSGETVREFLNIPGRLMVGEGKLSLINFN